MSEVSGMVLSEWVLSMLSDARSGLSSSVLHTNCAPMPVLVGTLCTRHTFTSVTVDVANLTVRVLPKIVHLIHMVSLDKWQA